MSEVPPLSVTPPCDVVDLVFCINTRCLGEYLSIPSKLFGMEVVVVDIQGFNLPQFVVKELSFVGGEYTAHYLFKSPVAYDTLSHKLKKHVLYLEDYHHGLDFKSGFLDYNAIYEILQKHILDRNIGLIYVKGYQKEQFLIEKLYEMNAAFHGTIVNVEHLNDNKVHEPLPTFIKSIPLCFYHKLNYCACSLRNAKELYDWVYNELPK